MVDFLEINKQIYTNSKADEVNYIYPVIKMDKNVKLSIVGYYDNSEEKIVNGIGKEIDFNINDYYYGLNPAYNTKEVLESLYKGVFKDVRSFNSFITEHANLFTVPLSMKKYSKALFAKTLIKMSVMFGYSFECSNEESFKLFEDLAKQYGNKNIDYDINKKLLTVRLLGHTAEDFINALNDKFCIDEKTGKLVIKEAQKNSYLTFSQHLTSCQRKLVQGKVYYSGVMPRVKNIKQLNENFANNAVEEYCVCFGRTTFATMDAFDSSYIKKHRLLKEFADLLDEIDKKEDALQSEFLYDLKDDNKINLANVNCYLSASLSTHTIAVSGNIITADDYVVLSKRGEKAIDNNSVYCSVNGQSEIYDKNVSFYNNSVYEDVPTLRIDHFGRIDFMNELTRETQAELDIFINPNNWQLRGLSFLTIFPCGTFEERNKRRFHFNILANAQTDKTLSEVIEKQKSATERFENSNIIGLKIKKHKNYFIKFLDTLKSIFIPIVKNEKLITSLFSIILFWISFKELASSEFTINSLSKYISLFFAIITSTILIKNIFVTLKNIIVKKKTHFELHINGKLKDFYQSIHIKFSKKHKLTLHPITDLMLWELIK